MIKKDIKGKLTFGDMIVDLDLYILKNKNDFSKQVDITIMEAEILRTILVCTNNGVIASLELLAKETNSSYCSLKTMICYLQKKLLLIESNYAIKSKHNLGYIMGLKTIDPRAETRKKAQ